MIFRLQGVEIYNFRGIKSLILDPSFNKFKECNIFVGPNGMGKSSLLAAIARLIPVLRGETNRLFLDSDFRFYDKENAHEIKIIYYINISLNKDDIENKILQHLASKGIMGRNFLQEDQKNRHEFNVRAEIIGGKIQKGMNRSFFK